MTQRNDGGSAFPSTPLGDDGKPGGAHRFGMSLRDWFAQSQPSDDIQELSYRHLSLAARRLLVEEQWPDAPGHDASQEEHVKYQIDKARWHAKVAAALRYMHADAMLAARSPAPEGGETDPAAGTRLAEIARIIECVDNRCLAADGPVTKTRHEITEDEMRAIYTLAKEGPSASPQPDPRDKLMPRIKECIEQLRDRLNETDRWQNGERNALPAFSQAVIFADRVLIDIQEALGDE